MFFHRRREPDIMRRQRQAVIDDIVSENVVIIANMRETLRKINNQ